ncbi:MAG: methyltransferase [Methanomassiliicoccales archaeon]
MQILKHIIIRECPGVYPPREDTFLLIKAIEVTPGERLLEMGCGTGIVSIHCAVAGAVVTAVDIDKKAIECTKRNAKCNDVQIDAVHSDLFSSTKGCFDTIIFNPPYIPANDDADGSVAWNGGECGTVVLARFLREAPRFLSEKGRIIVVVSSLMNENELKKILSDFKVERIAEMHLFFETISVLQLRPILH